MTDAFFDPTANPEQSNALIEAVLTDKTKAEEPPTVPEQPHGFVRLPGGLVRGKDAHSAVYDVQVRELTGEDEEYIDRVRRGRPDRFLEAVLERGVASIGGEPATKAVLNDLLLGDADFLFLEIRRATYGETIEYEKFVCPHCSEMIDVTVEMDDVPIKRLEDSSERFFDVGLRNGRVAHVRMPRFADLTSELASENLNDAEKKTLFLSRVIISIDVPGKDPIAVAGDPGEARRLSVQDRSTIVKALSKKKVGPDYNEVKFTHDSCGKEVFFPVDMGDLFPGL